MARSSTCAMARRAGPATRCRNTTCSGLSISTSVSRTTLLHILGDVDAHPGMSFVATFAGDERRALWSRWIFLRGLGLVFFSAFGSYAAQVTALIGPTGILPARSYLELVAR